MSCHVLLYLILFSLSDVKQGTTAENGWPKNGELIKQYIYMHILLLLS